MKDKPLTIHWFRQDLRLSDNPALAQAAQNASQMGGEVLPIYILDDENAGAGRMGAASRVWLHHSLKSLQQQLNSQLQFFCGDAERILQELVDELKPYAITWNRCYEPWRIKRDKRIKAMLQEQGVEVQSCNGSLLFEPWDILKNDSTPYKVFTPFYRKGCLNAVAPRVPLPAPEMKLADVRLQNALPLEALKLLPIIKWDEGIAKYWDISEAGAQSRLYDFVNNGLNDYKEGRNFPAKDNVSRLSPYLHFGEISPNQVWRAVQSSINPSPQPSPARGEGASFTLEDVGRTAVNINANQDLDHFLSELGWREFSYNLLYHNPNLPTRNLQTKFDAFPWVENSQHLQAWQNGRTGIPIVDAGMRELWQTGFMHNRVRMIVASVLVKNLRLDWRAGERWFWDCLFDADMANNAASWQWVAGSGADAAPYFRIFNPVTQGTKFDPDGEYVRKYVPELGDLPNKHLFAPWEAPPLILAGAGVELGKTYPKPIVDLSASREAALEAFAGLKMDKN
jgi:deoxyribodipyrimidine photo-lyase